MFTWIAETWCKAMHNRPMWPIHGKYVCQQCLREYSVPWEAPPLADEYAYPELRQAVPVTASTVSAVQ